MKFWYKIIIFLCFFLNFAFWEDFLELKMSDCIAPFFDSNEEIKHYSSLPYYQFDLKQEPYVDIQQLDDSFENYKIYLQALKKAGYNAISLDDVNHLLLLPKLWIYNWTDKEKRNQIYISYFYKLLDEAKNQWFQVFLITDMQFYTDEIKKYVWKLTPENKKLQEFNKLAFEELFKTFPDIWGIIVRIGEWWKAYNFDSWYYSQIIYKTPKQVNDFLKYILPVFSKHNKKLIFRTWSIWIWKIWNLNIDKNTYLQVFDDINSKNLIVSTKITPWDFFWFEKLNPIIWFADIPQIVEIQIRREYEWWWDFPNFFGDEYQQILNTLKTKKNIVWVRNWNQTWWWGRGNNILFNFGFYFRNQVNFEIVWKLLQNPDIDISQAIDEVLSWYDFTDNQRWVLKDILQNSRNIIKHGWYINDFRQKTLTLHNQYLPPLLWIWWDQITTSPLVLSLIYYSLDDPNNTLIESKLSLEIIKNNLNAREKVKSNTKLDEQIYFSLQNQYKIFEIIYLFKQSFVDYFSFGQKTNYQILIQKIDQYNQFKKDKPEFNFNFKEINKYFSFGKFQYFSWILFLINIFAFTWYLYLTLRYRKMKKLNLKKTYKNFLVFIWIFLAIFITIITPFLFISKYNFFWFLLKLNIVIIMFFYLYIFLASKIFARIFKQNIIFLKNLWNLFFLTLPAIVLLEITIIISQIFWEQIFWHILWNLVLSNYTKIWWVILVVLYLLIFIIFGLWFTNMRELIQSKKRKKIIYIVFGVWFVLFLIIGLFLDYKNIIVFELWENLYPNYFDEAGSSLWDFF